MMMMMVMPISPWPPNVTRPHATLRPPPSICPSRFSQQRIQHWSRLGKLFQCKASLDGEENNKENSSENKGNVNLDLGSSGSTNESSSEKDLEEPSKISMGSPLPGIKLSADTVKIPKDVMDILQAQVFTFDTFFATGREPYEGGVIFTGNLRGEASKSYAKMRKRLQDMFGEQYKLFLLSNPENDKPVVTVIPEEALLPESAAVPEWLTASLFGFVTFFTILIRNSPELQLNFLSSIGNVGLLIDSFPGAFVTALTLFVHEFGHYYAARNVGVELSFPFFIPSLQLGSFGGITRIKSIVQSRQALLEVAAAGPVAGMGFSLLIVLVGLFLSLGEGQGIPVNATAFHDSLLVGALGKFILGGLLKEGTSVALNPLVLWGWAGLLINAINCIPVGELDGGRISLALWGRKVASRVSAVSIGLLGLSALFSDVALYWVVLVLFLQRGPIAPQAEEITSPDSSRIALGIAVLSLGLLVCLPFPWTFSSNTSL